MIWLSILPSDCTESVCDISAERLQSEKKISKVSRFLDKAHYDNRPNQSVSFSAWIMHKADYA